MDSDAVIGERIKGLRESRQLSREVAAGLMGRSSRWLQNVEHGKSTLSVNDIDTMAGVLGVNPLALFGLVEAGDDPKDRGCVVRPQRLLEVGGASLRPAASIAAAVPTVAAQCSLDDRECDGTACALPITNLGELAEAIEVASQESAIFLRRAGMLVETVFLDQIEAEVRQLSIRYMGEPPYVLFAPLARLRAEVFRLLDTHQPAEHTRRLYLYAGQLCALLGHMSTDLAHPDAAETHARTAWLCADLCDHNGLRCYVRWVQAQLAYWRGDYRTAADIMTNARQYATDRTSLLRVASQEARAWAAAGDRPQVQWALDQVAQARAAGLPEEMLTGVFGFPAGKAAYYTAEAHLSLGTTSDLRLAASEAQDALQILNAAPPEQTSRELVAAARLDLVAAHLGLRSLDGAVEHIRPVLALTTEHRTIPIVNRMGAIGHAIEAADYSADPSAQALREQIALFRSYPAARELPAVNQPGKEA